MPKSSIFVAAFAAAFVGQVSSAALFPVLAMPYVADFATDHTRRTSPEGLLLVQYDSQPESHTSVDTNSGAIDNERDPNLSTSHSFNDQVTRGVVWMIESGSRECGGTLRPEYRFDCLKNVLARTASTIEGRPHYRDAARELRSLSRKLDSIVTRYQDTSAPRATIGRRSYRAVSQASLAKANREAAAAIEETVTKLLRSAGNSEKRKVHYSQIAAAVGSTKRLLRS